MRHIPNILSGLRILMVGVFVYFFLTESYTAALITFLVAFGTDLLDGYLARRYNWISNLGKILDPFADKLLMVVALICFCIAGWIPLYVVILTAVKELLMIVGGLFLLNRKVVVYADWFGKISAGAFSAGVVLTFGRYYFPQIAPWHVVMFIIAIVLAYIALIHYFVKSMLPSLVGKKDEEEEKQ